MVVQIGFEALLPETERGFIGEVVNWLVKCGNSTSSKFVHEFFAISELSCCSSFVKKGPLLSRWAKFLEDPAKRIDERKKTSPCFLGTLLCKCADDHGLTPQVILQLVR